MYSVYDANDQRLTQLSTIKHKQQLNKTIEKDNQKESGLGVIAPALPIPPPLQKKKIFNDLRSLLISLYQKSCQWPFMDATSVRDVIKYGSIR